MSDAVALKVSFGANGTRLETPLILIPELPELRRLALALGILLLGLALLTARPTGAPQPPADPRDAAVRHVTDQAPGSPQPPPPRLAATGG